jgi:L-cysteine/cystine lyase
MSIASPSVDLRVYRQHFPALANKAYFNYGGQGPLPHSALEAIQASQLHIQLAGPFGNDVNRWIHQETSQIRRAIAQILHVSPATITLTENVTIGCNIALWGLEWQPGDHILLSDCEHPGVIAAVNELQQRFGVHASTCPIMATLNQGDPVEAIAQHLTPKTRLVIVSHILWNTGQVLPLQEIVVACRQQSSPSRPIRVLVDAAQSVGVLPLNLAEIGADFYAFTGHKWLCGPAGVGGLYVHPDAFESLRPTFIGWRGVTKNETGQPTGWEPDGRRYEVATSDFSLYSGLREAIALHETWGSAEQRYQAIRRLSSYLWSQLSQLPQISCLRTEPPEAGLVSFQLGDRLPSAHSTLVESLERDRFMLRTLLDPDCIRACVHYFSTEDEIDQMVHTLKRLITE